MPSQHARLGPSDAERWMSCPAAIQAEETAGIVEAESTYAREGTAAHGLGEIKASLHFGKITKRQFTARRAAWAKEFEEYAEDPEIMVEMEEHTDAYVALLQERMDLFPGSILFLEIRVFPGVPECWGTSDAVIVSPAHIEVIDFKYGAGVAVEAHGNPQLRLYGAGALEEYGNLLGDTELVRITVHQPRMSHILTEEMTPETLLKWRDDEVIPKAEEALGPDPSFGPSEAACRWCPLSGQCRAQLESIFDAVDFDVEPDTLSPAEIAEVYAKRKQVSDWLNALEVAALDMAYSQGKTLPGFKVVLSGGQRRVTDPVKAVEILEAEGFTKEEVTVTKPKGIGDLEKLLGKERFIELLEEPGLVQKSEGKPAIAPESDKRPSITPNNEAAREFAAAEEEDLI